MPDDNYSLLRADIAAGFKHDERLRAVEQEQAATRAVIAQLPDMKRELLEAIRDSRPKSPWPAVSAIVAAGGLFLVLAAAIYQR